MAVATPVNSPAQVNELTFGRRSKSDCNGGLLGSLDSVLEQILPELKPILEGVDATEDQIGKAIPLVGDLLKLLDALCI
ncbi:hypothetical protein MYAM1_003600 [Malassezia yamatoensis]|uniref:Uncharacterized protein n=1 Tax=Malassezia yamatoensis TaxID=253288 RepID=A0AAJ6CIC9_9BASI|nr:hypothetical protein MYAM1_003600 [Malassezia yamatoensis]